VPWLLLIPLAFLSGSIPFGLIIARSRGVDIRKHGSGNIGATNVWRVLGRGPGLLCFALDVLKGLAPTLLAGWWAGLLHGDVPAPRESWLWLAVMAAPILGHMFTPFAGFKGGKGVATGLGAMLGVFPWLHFAAWMCLGIWIAAAAISRYVSVASCLASLALPLGVAAFNWDRIREPGLRPFLLATTALAALVIFKHRANLRRLLAGTENRIGARPPGQP
jgi:glycerol-3-phosphate acyltransferase PlsY